MRDLSADFFFIPIFSVVQKITEPALIILSHEPMDIPKCCTASPEMLCWAFTAAALSCCLLVSVSASSFVFSTWKAYSLGLRSGDWLGHWRISHLSALRNSSVAIAVCFLGHLVHDASALADQFCNIWLNLSKEHRSVHLRTHRAAHQ